jgi:hypothetical protein
MAIQTHRQEDAGHRQVMQWRTSLPQPYPLSIIVKQATALDVPMRRMIAFAASLLAFAAPAFGQIVSPGTGGVGSASGLQFGAASQLGTTASGLSGPPGNLNIGSLNNSLNINNGQTGLTGSAFEPFGTSAGISGLNGSAGSGSAPGVAGSFNLTSSPGLTGMNMSNGLAGPQGASLVAPIQNPSGIGSGPGVTTNAGLNPGNLLNDLAENQNNVLTAGSGNAIGSLNRSGASAGSVNAGSTGTSGAGSTSSAPVVCEPQVFPCL